MKRNLIKTLYILMACGLILAPLACGGGGGSSDSDSAVYNGSTDPAVADSTTSATLVEYSLGVVEAGNPLAGAFLGAASPPVGPAAPIAVPQVTPYITTTVSVTMAQIREQDSGAGYISGAQYESGMGTGTAVLAGSAVVKLHLGTWEEIPGPETVWNVDWAEYEGDIVFDGFATGDQPPVTGTVTMAPAEFTFSNEAGFSLTGGFTGDPGLPIWNYAAMTFGSITVSSFGDSWILGEGDWEMEIEAGSYMGIAVNSMTVLYDGATYKLEDAYLDLEVYPGEGTVFTVYGNSDSYATFYHPDLGKVWFEGYVAVGEESEAIESGEMHFYDAPGELADPLIDVEFVYDSIEGATAYWIGVYEDFVELYGYIVDGVWTPDPDAMYAFIV